MMIRKARYSDIESIERIRFECYWEDHFKYIHANLKNNIRIVKRKWIILPFIRNMANIMRKLKHKEKMLDDLITYVAEYRNKVVGYFEIQFINDICYGANSGVSLSARSKGIGKKLYLNWVQVGKQMNYKHFSGHISSENYAVNSILQNMGLKKTNERTLLYYYNFKENQLKNYKNEIWLEKIGKSNLSGIDNIANKKFYDVIRYRITRSPFKKIYDNFIDTLLHIKINTQYLIKNRNSICGIINVNLRKGNKYANVDFTLKDFNFHTFCQILSELKDVLSNYGVEGIVITINNTQKNYQRYQNLFLKTNFYKIYDAIKFELTL